MSESMIRLDCRRDFTVLQNGMLRDKRLSLKTKGLFAVMLSRPGTWQFSVSGLAVYTGAGRDAIRSALKELREAGYLTVEKQSHGEHGKFAGSVYILHEESKSPCTENPATVEEDPPQPDFPSTAGPAAAEPSTENPTQVNTDKAKTEESKIPPKTPQGGRGNKYKLTDDARDLLNGYVGGDRELAEAMEALIEVRAAKKAVNSARGIRMLLADLDRLSGGDRGVKLLLLRQSTVSSWKGIFPLRGQGGPAQGAGRTVERGEVPTW